MLRRFIAIGLIAFLTAVALNDDALAQSTKQSERNLQRIKKTVAKYAVPGGPAVHVDLIRGRKKLKGHISNQTDTTFVVTDSRTGMTTTVNYADVRNVSHPIPLWVKLPIIAGAVVLLTRVKFRELP